MNNHERLERTSVSLALVVGLAIYRLLSNFQLQIYQNFIITFLASSAFYEFVFKILIYLFSNVDFLLKILWGKLYLKGYWDYTYELNGVKKYGVWCIDQTYNSTTVKGFGISEVDGKRRSDVQSITQLIKRGNDYEILNTRRDVDANGSFGDEFFYSKTSMHLVQRNTFLNLLNYPMVITGVTIVYGGEKSGNHHGNLQFHKHKNAKSETDIEEIVKKMIEDEKSTS